MIPSEDLLVRHLLFLALLLVGYAAAPHPAFASSLPGADSGPAPVVGLGLGVDGGWRATGSFGAALPLARQGGVGASFSTSSSRRLWEGHGLYRLVSMGPDGPAIAAMGGVWGASGLDGFTLPGAWAPWVGVGLAYGFAGRFVFRLNLLYSPFFHYEREFLIFLGGPPSSGVELSYRLSGPLELTVGLNGHGDLAGLRWQF